MTLWSAQLLGTGRATGSTALKAGAAVVGPRVLDLPDDGGFDSGRLLTRPTELSSEAGRSLLLPSEPADAAPAAAGLRRQVLGVPVDNCTLDGLLATVSRWIDDNDQHFAVGINAHVVNLARTDAAYRAVLSRSGLNYPDGQALVWACNLLGHPVEERLATSDVVHPLAANWARRGDRVFLFGGQAGVADRASAELRNRYPGLRIVGVRDGYRDNGDFDRAIEAINASEADVLLVGLGNPVQEFWVARNLGRLRAPAVLTCGGLFDWLAGRHPRPPQWISSAGLEWLYRLRREPRRLGRRYLVGNPRFLSWLAMELLNGSSR